MALNDDSNEVETDAIIASSYHFLQLRRAGVSCTAAFSWILDLVWLARPSLRKVSSEI
jgi:hypothetical protein